MGRRVGIVQSSYIPWKGYFDLINSVDEFILFDDVQYTRRDWRNRNRIKTPNGPLWLTIPVEVKGRYLQKVRETRISDPRWAAAHWRTIAANYARAPFFDEYRHVFEDLYASTSERMLSAVNHRFLAAICGLLGIRTRLSWSMDYEIVDGKTERLVHLCRQAGATEYLSGPSASDYIVPALFEQAGIELRYMDYRGYPGYPQINGDFDHFVSIVDLIFNAGPAAPAYMKSFAVERSAP